MKSISSQIILIVSATIIFGCTKLNETAGGDLNPSQIISNNTSDQLLTGVYKSMNNTFTNFQEIFALSELSTDEAIAPTRANNWDDNGIWRSLHEQNWDANNSQINNTFNSLGGVIYTATDMLQYKPSSQQQAEARFIRAWAMYWLLDLFDQVPYRQPGEMVTKAANVLKGDSALIYIISEINAIEPDLPDGPVTKANKSAARALLMKCYLNRSIYKNRVSPSPADPADMNKVINYADTIILNSNPKFQFSINYFDNFSPVNASTGLENIFTLQSNGDQNYVLSLAWIAVLDYAQNGANGFTTLPEFYNLFEPVDKRRQAIYTYPGGPVNNGYVNMGFLIGQQFDLTTGDSLFDNFIPVNYTPEVQNIEPGPNVEMPGIRPMKYAIDYSHPNPGYGPPDNNYVCLRFPDVLLMKAEAILRDGTPTVAGIYGSDAQSLVNAIRQDPSRGVGPMLSVNLDSIYNERGRELWWECWRRQDMIRFQKFLLPTKTKPNLSDPKYLLFPIPNQQLAVNPNLKQNPGYTP